MVDTAVKSEFKLSPRTKSVITNFSQINPSMLFKPGTELRTISPNQDVMAVAKIVESFPVQFGIYDLSKLLAIVSTNDDPGLKFGELYLTITNQKNTNKYYDYRYTSATMILLPPEEDLERTNVVAEFDLPMEDLAEVIKITSIAKHPIISFICKDGVLMVKASDTKNPNSDVYYNVLNRNATFDSFNVRFKVEKLAMLMPDDYKVTLGDVCFFESTDVTYSIQAED